MDISGFLHKLGLMIHAMIDAPVDIKILVGVVIFIGMVVIAAIWIYK